MGRVVNSLIGQQFGNLIVINDSGERFNRHPLWNCSCSCGNQTKVRGDILKSGLTISCGCLQGKRIILSTLNSGNILFKAPSKSYAIKLKTAANKKLNNQQTKFDLFKLDITNIFPNLIFTNFTVNKSDVLLEQSSMSALLYIDLSKYNQEYLVNNKICSNYAECKRYILKITEELQKLGYRTVVVYESEWQNKKNQIINFIKSVLKQNNITVYGRKCIVSNISKQDANTFLSEHHIQGPARISTHFYGLYHNLDLIAVLTFGKHHRAQSVWNKPTVAVLDRLAIASGYNIPGGSSKLLSFAEKDLKLQKFDTIVSWADKRISSGNLYVALGFSLYQDLLPDYSYFCSVESIKENKCMVRGKQANKKSNLPMILPGETELDCTKRIGHFRTYDCGKLVFVKKIS